MAAGKIDRDRGRSQGGKKIHEKSSTDVMELSAIISKNLGNSLISGFTGGVDVEDVADKFGGLVRSRNIRGFA